MAELSVRKARKTYNGKTVVHDVDVTVEDGAFCTMLGPSGSGKTTILQLIAGLEPMDSGDVRLGGRDITRFHPEKRNIGIVFQSYALFPHLSIADNVAYGLKSRKISRREQKRRVDDMLALVGLHEIPDRKPTQLSGGQQQRVALARALVIEPDLLLLDEPLSALDRKIRGEMQTEIARIHRETGVTTVMVTHDQEEALDLADQVVLLQDGHIRQHAAPRTMYDQPASPFVANFLGAQCFTGVFSRRNGSPVVSFADFEFSVGDHPSLSDGQSVIVAVAPEAVRVEKKRTNGAAGTNSAVLIRTSFLGPTTELVVRSLTGTEPIRSIMLSDGSETLAPNDEVDVRVDPSGLRVFAA